MRNCRECSTSLVIGQNITVARYNKKNYICTPCTAEAYRNDRAKLIKLYGGCCKYCGETRQERLQLDHIHGDAREDRAKLKHIKHKKNKSRTIWKNALVTYQPNKYQILCDKCNAAKGDESEEEFFAWVKRVYERNNKDVPSNRYGNWRIRAKRKRASYIISRHF